MNFISFTTLIIYISVGTAQCARILGIFYFPSKSHHILGSELFITLAQRGHEVTMLSPYTIGEPMKNYKEIILHEMLEYKEAYMQDIIKPDKKNSFLRFREITQQIKKLTDLFWESKAVQGLLKSEELYDLVIVTSMLNDCSLGIAHRFGAQTIVLSTVGSNIMTNRYTGNPMPYSYIPVFPSGSSNEMTYLDRVKNTGLGILSEIMWYFELQQQEECRRKHLPEVPPIQDLIQNVSLVFLNSHYSIESIRPYLPSMIQIGGFHVKEPKELPNDIKIFLDGAKDGAIFFSLGSNVKLSQLPNGKKEIIIKTLGNLKQKVLLKSDEVIDNLPRNIKIGKWFPQNDILAHPNIKAFITHGGLLSTIEAVYHGVPILGLPCFGDQEQNMLDTQAAGYAIKLDILSLDEATFHSAIMDILNNRKYKENIRKRSALLREQPVKPMDKAIFWVEHVIKHGGADYLRSPKQKLYLYQYLLLDVIAFIAIMLIMFLVIVYFIIRTIVNTVCHLKSKIKTD